MGLTQGPSPGLLYPLGMVGLHRVSLTLEPRTYPASFQFGQAPGTFLRDGILLGH